MSALKNAAVLAAALSLLVIKQAQAAPIIEEKTAGTSYMDEILRAEPYKPAQAQDLKEEEGKSDRVRVSLRADGTTVETVSGNWGRIVTEKPLSTSNGLMKRETTELKKSPLPGLKRTIIEDYENGSQKVISIYENGNIETITYKQGAKVHVSMKAASHSS